jgi:putative hemolysin
MTPITQNHYRAEITQNAVLVRAAQDLRRLCFTTGTGLPDGDEFDADYQHVLIYDDTNVLVCTFRFLHLTTGRDVDRTYSGAYYNLAPLRCNNQPMIEMGRFCIHPERTDPNILRYAWSILTKFVDDNNITLIFGCSSFRGTDAALFHDTFALLKHRFLAPRHLAPLAKARITHAFGEMPSIGAFDLKKATKSMPPLLRTYLAMGGKVSDHAVVDHELNTIHVFTAIEIDEIPPARKRWLRASVH